jgi:hypothetical protein
MKYRTGEPEYFDDMSDVFLECNLYDMVTQKLVYSAQSRSFSISDYNKETDLLLRKIIKDLTKGHNAANEKTREMKPMKDKTHLAC